MFSRENNVLIIKGHFNKIRDWIIIVKLILYITEDALY
jgi:hypothetical protein